MKPRPAQTDALTQTPSAPEAPPPPPTQYQQRPRAILAAVAARWRLLTPAERDTWHRLAPQLPDQLSGFDLYTQVNANRLTMGCDLFDNAPELPCFGILTFGSFTALHAAAPPHPLTLSLPLQNTRLPDGYLYEATRPMSQGISNPGSAYRLIATAPGQAPLSPDQLTQAYLQRFGDPPDGQAIFFRLHPITHGLRGVSFTFSAIVARAQAP